MYKRQEMFRKTLDFIEAGDNAGCLLRGIAKTDIERGQVLCKPGSIHPHTCLLYTSSPTMPGADSSP